MERATGILEFPARRPRPRMPRPLPPAAGQGPDGLAGPASRRSLFVWSLAALAPLDMVLAQVQSMLDPRIGALSLAQAYHGAVLVVMLGILAARLHAIPSRHRIVPVASGLFAAALAMSLLNNFVMGRLALEDIVASLQVAYWLALWLTAMIVCRHPRDFRLVLTGVAAAGVYAALSVVYFRLTGQTDMLPYQGVAASAGGLNTAKGLGGILIMGGLSAVWLSRLRHEIWGLLCFGLCLAGLFLTYQRAGLVAAAMLLAWLGGWYVVRGFGRADAAWARNVLVVATVTCVFLLVVIGTSDLQKRWADLPDPEKAGSARLAFWQIALQHYADLGPADKLCGIGYAGLIDAMENQHGHRIHAHSDLLDVLAMFGAIGTIGFLAVHYAILRILWTGGRGSSALAACIGAYLVLLSESLLTGQMFGPHVMGPYLLTITAISLGSAARAAKAPALGRPRPVPPRRNPAHVARASNL